MCAWRTAVRTSNGHSSFAEPKINNDALSNGHSSAHQKFQKAGLAHEAPSHMHALCMPWLASVNHTFVVMREAQPIPRSRYVVKLRQSCDNSCGKVNHYQRSCVISDRPVAIHSGGISQARDDEAMNNIQQYPWRKGMPQVAKLDTKKSALVHGVTRMRSAHS